MHLGRLSLLLTLLLAAVESPAQPIREATALSSSLGARLSETETVPAVERPRVESAWDVFRVAPPPPEPSIRLGQNWNFRLRAAAGAAYDDNLVQSAIAVADAYAFLLPDLRLNWEPAHLPEGSGLLVSYAPKGYYYQNETQYDRWDQTFNASLSLLRGRSRLDASHIYNDTAQPSISESGRTDRRQHVSSLQLDRQFGQKSRLSLNARRDDLDVTSYATLEYAAGGLAEILPRESLALGLGYRFRHIDSSPASGAAAVSVVHEPTVNFRWRSSDKLLLDLRAGLQLSEADSSGVVRDFNSPLVMLSLNYDYSEKTSIVLGFSMEQRISSFTAGQLDQTARVNWRAVHRLTGKITFSADGLIGQTEQTAADPAKSSGGSYTFWQIGAGIAYAMTPRSEVSLRYSHLDRSGSQITEAFTRNIFELAYSHRF